MLVDGRLWSRDAAIAAGFTCEGDTAGSYAWIIDTGAHPHRRDDRFARLVLGRGGLVPPGQMIVRPRNATAWSPASDDAVLWSDDGEDVRGDADPIGSLPLVGDDEGTFGDDDISGVVSADPWAGDAAYDEPQDDSGWSLAPGDGEGMDSTRGDGWSMADARGTGRIDGLWKIGSKRKRRQS